MAEKKQQTEEKKPEKPEPPEIDLSNRPDLQLEAELLFPKAD